MKHPIRFAVVFAVVTVSNLAEGQVLMGTAFTYQGRLSEAGAPVNSDVDLEFTLWNDPVGSLPANQIAPPVVVFNQVVSEGLFTAVLDFGPAAFNGDGRWLEIRVGPAGGALTTLSPRQELTPAPHALALPGLYTQQNPTSPNLIGGRADNSVTSGVAGATIGGGGSAGVDNNRVTDDFGTIGGGDRNQAGNNSGTTTDRPYATVGGGQNNSASGNRSTVSGGESNSASGQRTFVGGGLSNQATGTYATISGGRSNLASGSYTTVSGGGPSDTGNVNNTRNRVTDDYGAIGGGGNNQAGDNAGTSADHAFATVSGGEANIASGAHSTVPGGQLNTAAGGFSLAAGRRAKAMHDGSVVIADSTDEDFSSTASDQFLARATGGVRLNVDTAGGGLRIEPTFDNSFDYEGNNLIAGHAINQIFPDVVAGTIGGGGLIDDTSGSEGGPYPYSNIVTDTGCTVSGGLYNRAGDGLGSTDDALAATVGGGFGNGAGGLLSTVGGGQFNTASGWYGTVGGGESNTASGSASTAPGGTGNVAGGDFSLAAGRQAKVRSAAEVGGGDTDGDEGSFVWADSTNADFISTGPNQFLIRASGGVGIGTTTPGAKLHVQAPLGSSVAADPLFTAQNTQDSAASIRLTTIFRSWRVGQNRPPDNVSKLDSFFVFDESAAATRLLIDTSGWVGIGTTSPLSPLEMASGARCTVGGVWTNACDRNLKENFQPVNGKAILEKVARLPVQVWNYKNEGRSIQHIGPTAQEFRSAFDFGGDDKSIGTIDADGVALAAIQGLHESLREKDQRIAELTSRLERLENVWSAAQSEKRGVK